MAHVVTPEVMAGEPLAAVWRGGILEGVHSGHLRVEDAAGTVVLRRGADVEFFPRSSLKPFQALALLRAGADLDGPALALACASHAGTPDHVAVADAMLADAGLDRSALQNTPGLPFDESAAAAVLARGEVGAPVYQNCSGKHAGMLTACVAAGWDTTTYRDPDHPLQRLIAHTLAELTGGDLRWSVDGCGAPTATTTLSGLSRAIRALVTAAEGSLERRVVDAMRAHPRLVSGTGRFDTLAMEHVRGLVAKGGAEGVLMAATATGATIVAKVADGNHRANTPAFVAALAALGIEADTCWAVAEVLGHGRAVGRVEWIEQAQA